MGWQRRSGRRRARPRARPRPRRLRRVECGGGGDGGGGGGGGAGGGASTPRVCQRRARPLPARVSPPWASGGRRGVVVPHVVGTTASVGGGGCHLGLHRPLPRPWSLGAPRGGGAHPPPQCVSVGRPPAAGLRRRRRRRRRRRQRRRQRQRWAARTHATGFARGAVAAARRAPRGRLPRLRRRLGGGGAR